MGVLYYEMNTGDLPFDGSGDRIKLVNEIKTKPTPDLPNEFTLVSHLIKRLNINEIQLF